MLAWNRLRIDSGDGATAIDYRIEDGGVESRRVQTGQHQCEVMRRWHRLSPEELSSLVMSNKVVAHWLTRRMGTFAVVRACSGTNIGAVDGSHPDSMAA